LDNLAGTHDDASARRAPAMERTGLLSRRITHELANLLTVASARTRFALSALPTDSEARVHLDEAAIAITRASSLLRPLARSDVSDLWRPQLVDLNGLVAALEPVLGAVLGKGTDVQVTTSARQAFAYLDGSRLERTILTLALSQADSALPGGVFTLGTKTRELDDRVASAFDVRGAMPYTQLTASCTLPVDAAESLDGMLQHWVTSDEQPAIGWRDAASAAAKLPHDAGYMLVQQVNGGLHLSVYVPPPAASAIPRAPLREREQERASRTVMVVEDVAVILRVMTSSLRREGYAVLAASEGAGALALADVHGATIDVLVTDISMPGMTGRELARALRERHPNLLTVYVSGSAGETFAELDLPDAEVFLSKPFSGEALAQIVSTLLDRRYV
jgi:two-component system cell cycle sensor histidine kinase/response regulator CckA